MYFFKFSTCTLSGLHLFVFPLEVYCFLAHVPFARKCNVQSVQVQKNSLVSVIQWNLNIAWWTARDRQNVSTIMSFIILRLYWSFPSYLNITGMKNNIVMPRTSLYIWVCTGGSVAERLGCRTCKSEAQSSSPALTASWSDVLSHPKFKSSTTVINSQLVGFLTPSHSISIICFRRLLHPTSTTSANTYCKG